MSGWSVSEWRETRKAIKMFGLLKVLYWRLIYRHHMRFIHRRGGHQFTYLRPYGGPSQFWCQWCGHRELVWKDLPWRSGQTNAAAAAGTHYRKPNAPRGGSFHA